MRTKLIAGNWKSYKTLAETEQFFAAFENLRSELSSCTAEIALMVPFPYLVSAEAASKKIGFLSGAQNCSAFGMGAYTGEVSAAMLSSIGINICIVGHSERRTIFNETNETLRSKVSELLSNNITPVFCVGESLEQRTNEEQFIFIASQLNEGLFHLDAASFSKLIIAYEPIWAIGTGLNATPEQANEMHQYIRNLISKKYSPEIANQCRILYGGSMKPSNCKELLSMNEIDGGLIGGASLDADSFFQIIKSIN